MRLYYTYTYNIMSNSKSPENRKKNDIIKKYQAENKEGIRGGGMSNNEQMSSQGGGTAKTKPLPPIQRTIKKPPRENQEGRTRKHKKLRNTLLQVPEFYLCFRHLPQ